MTPRQIDEGVIKFECRWIKGPPLADSLLRELNFWRQALYRRGLIGYDKVFDVGYGNISIRDADSMIISGTQTGHLPVLTGMHYARVSDFSIESNRLTCEGPIKASSEALTHLAIYELDPDYRAVVHVHSPAMWRAELNKLPTTTDNVRYGTPEMAVEFARLYRETDFSDRRLAVMAGHDGGIISCGRDLKEAAESILKHRI